MAANANFARPRCTQRKQPIFNQISTMVDGKIYHTYHFQCCSCHKVLKSTYTTHRGQVYCTNCHKLTINNICAVCNKPVEETCLEIMNCHYHFKCFTCSTCGQPFDDGVFYPISDEIYCVNDQWGARMELERNKNRKRSIADRSSPTRNKKKRPKGYTKSK